MRESARVEPRNNSAGVAAHRRQGAPRLGEDDGLEELRPVRTISIAEKCRQDQPKLRSDRCSLRERALEVEAILDAWQLEACAQNAIAEANNTQKVLSSGQW